MPDASPQVIHDSQRLAALDRLLLLDSPAEEAFDRLTRLASDIIQAPVSLVSLVASNRQFFKSAVGVPIRETDLSHSFCQHVVADQTPLIIADARKHPLVHDNLAIPDLNVIAYLGMPLTLSSGEGLGSFCVIDSQPRTWSQREIDIMYQLSLSAISELELRSELLRRKENEAIIAAQNLRLHRMTELARSTVEHMIGVVQHGSTTAEMLNYLNRVQKDLTEQTA